MRWIFVIVVALGVLAAGSLADADRATERTRLERNQTLWAGQHLRDYRFRLRVQCFCPERGKATTVTVRRGRPHGATGFQTKLDTVPEMFRQIRRALDDRDAGEVEIRYDTRRGFPRRASIDQIKMAIDDEIGWTVDRFRVLR